MPTFDTPEPISVTLELGTGAIRITASDRADTAVEVRPTDPSDGSDVETAQQVRVDFTGGTVRIAGPKSGLFDLSRKTRSVEVSIDLPSGSRVAAETQLGDFHCAGRLGEARFKTSAGNVTVDRAGPLHVRTSAGHINVDAVSGNADISTGSGKIEIGAIDGSAIVKNSNGDTEIETVSGELRVRAGNGSIQVGRAASGVDVKTSNGPIRLGEVVRGTVTVGTAMGDLDIGIAKGTAAWLEINTSFGHLRNHLDGAVAPEASDETVEIRGHTSYGDITIRRS